MLLLPSYTPLPRDRAQTPEASRRRLSRTSDGRREAGSTGAGTTAGASRSPSAEVAALRPPRLPAPPTPTGHRPQASSHCASGPPRLQLQLVSSQPALPRFLSLPSSLSSDMRTTGLQILFFFRKKLNKFS